jgi:predicted transcriptional regulator
MLIKEIMKTGVCECTEDASLAEVYELITSSPESFVVVVESSQHRVPLGIVNEHTLCENLVKRFRRDRDLYAENLMSSNIEKISENADVRDCSQLLNKEADVFVVVNEKRQFRGVVDAAELERAIAAVGRKERSSSIAASIMGHAIPASVEIPAFEWLK